MLGLVPLDTPTLIFDRMGESGVSRVEFRVRYARGDPATSRNSRAAGGC